MNDRGLIFIPDISGFTKFVNETELDHSRVIIKELLEVLINANTLGLELSEIEGDAILFYKFGNPPSLEDLYRQVEKMFCDFHQSLSVYDQTRYCQCQACLAAVSLSLKVITHYGEFTRYNISHFNKLIGKDVIVAHQLLKNDIPQHEYWLITQSLAGTDGPTSFTPWMEWNADSQADAGKVPYLFTQLGPLKETVKNAPLPRLDLRDKRKIYSVTEEMEIDIITLFHATGDFNHRHQWQEGVKQVQEVNHFLPRVGMRCRCVLDNGEQYIFSSSYHYQGDRIEFSESDEAGNQITYFTLLKTGKRKTKLTIDIYTPSTLSHFIQSFVRRNQLKARYDHSLSRLKTFVQTLNVPSADLT